MVALSDPVFVALIGAGQVVVLAAVAALLKVLTSRQVAAVGAKVVEVAATVEAVHADTVSVNAAVNHKESGMPTLVQRVVEQDVHTKHVAAELERSTDWTQKVLSRIADHLAVDVPLVPPPASIPEMTTPAG